MASRSILVWPVLGRKEVNEKSEQSFLIRFLSARALSAPTTARYKLISVTTGETVVDWTSIGSPTSEETVSIDGQYHTIRAGFPKETYELVVQSDHDDSTARMSQSLRYKVCDIEAVAD